MIFEFEIIEILFNFLEKNFKINTFRYQFLKLLINDSKCLFTFRNYLLLFKIMILCTKSKLKLIFGQK